MDDVRQAIRTLSREKDVVALVVFTLALGIGSTAVVFSIADQLLLRRPAGVHADGNSAYLRLESSGGKEQQLTTPELDELRRDATLLEDIASYNFDVFEASVGDARGVRADAALIYGDYFKIAGARPAAGHLLRKDETGFDGDGRLTVISQAIAATFFGSSESAVGRLVLESTTRILTFGTLLGLGGAYILSRSLENRLFGVSPLDFPSYILSAICSGWWRPLHVQSQRGVLSTLIQSHHCVASSERIDRL
ncbi:MAG TPA: ABC transporter permease [Gemmatimonadaceae bacterium]